MDGLTAAGPRHSVQICKKPDRKRPSARQLLDLTPSLSVPRQERVELVLIDARFVVSGCLEALQICRTARASSSTSHLTVQEPPAAPHRERESICNSFGRPVTNLQLTLARATLLTPRARLEAAICTPHSSVAICLLAVYSNCTVPTMIVRTYMY